MKKLVLILGLIQLVGCATPKEIVREVPVEVVHEVEKKLYVHDSIFTQDSIIVYQQGDTVVKERVKTNYISKTVHDTLTTHDTIPVILTNTITETEIVKEPQWWPVWLSLGALCIVLLLTKTNTINLVKNFINYIIKLFK